MTRSTDTASSTEPAASPACHAPRTLDETKGSPLYAAIAEGKIDSTFLISHRMALEEGPEGYRRFHDDQDNMTKIVLKPGMIQAA